ncbi:MAG: AAA family ATPase, partial [Bacteroidales bacterium]|nr:AAA family ATPase [Bacteroidales bacterium]
LRSGVVQQPLRKAYSLLNKAYRLLINRNTEFVTLHLVGPFAKTDYLLKNNEADVSLRQMVNATRVRLHRIANDDGGEVLTEASLREDYEALARFVALIYHCPIPAEVEALFLPRRSAQTHRAVVSQRMRIVVDRWDENRIYGTVDDDEATEVMVRYTGDDLNVYHYDWSGIGQMLFKGAQLNIINATRQGDDLLPELIILEPDYLVDITTIASCFETYAHSPLVALIGKLKPSPNSSAIQLGNLVGQLLDDEVHHPDGEVPYADSAKRFFQQSALSILTTDIDPDFHQNARRQKANIHQAVGVTLPKLVKSYDVRKVLLEPSFFCEMLGLQGRMDFLQMDHEVLIEQKSGKCGWPQRDPDTPVQQIKHQVQTLLYMALLRYNYADRQRRNQQEGHGLQAFLMYSKYPNSLLGIGYAPNLVFEALMMRNAIARKEIDYADGGMDILTTLTPDGLNTLRAGGKLWEQYTRPELTRILQPLHTCSDLERAYYMRFMTFVAREHLLSKVGNRRKACSGFASVWLETVEDKRQSGDIYDHLQLAAPAADHEGVVEEVSFLIADDENHDMANFRQGDIVMFYPYQPQSVPDARLTMVLRGSIKSISESDVVIHLRAPQGDAKPFLANAANLWAMEHDFMEASYSGLYRGIHSFLSAPEKWRSLLLMQREPQIDTSLTLKGHYGDFDDLMLRVKQARDLFLIIGPPGTGKTSFGLVNTLCEQLLEPDTNILLMAYTNRAVDEICDKLIEHQIDFMRIGSEMSCGAKSRDYLIDKRIADCANAQAMKSRIDAMRVFVGTTASMTSNISLLQLKHFHLAIIDEASQILEPHILGIFSASTMGVPAIDKVVMIGDHKQLPAVVQQSVEDSAVSDPRLHAIGLTNCRYSLFERLLRRYGSNISLCHMLTRQGRMHQDIATFPSNAFYGGRLCVVPLPHQTEALLPAQSLSDILSHRLSFIDVQCSEPQPSDKVNNPEAFRIAMLAEQIYRREAADFNPDSTLGIIVPYRNQIAAVRAAIAQYGIDALTDITIDTVERYQGSQRDYIIYGLTVTQRYQLDFLAETTFEENGEQIDRKLNVALTRARLYQIVVGNAQLVSQLPLYARMIKYIKEQNAFFETE